MNRLLTLQGAGVVPTSIRAKAMVFEDPRSLALIQEVERIARTDATILVTGETGAGKEIIVRHIHKVSGRKGPFIAVNCGALSENLIEAELFGHELGAFTGAIQARPGWFEAAEGGTLFLDEVGDLPMNLQVKLLRVLQDGQVTRLGSRSPIALDVRLIAATNVDLALAVAAQHFRADLYYRLHVAAINLPPLRERPADILPLANHFLQTLQARLHYPQQVNLSTEVQRLLLAYHWPGNIRELENVIHHALIVCQGGVIRSHDVHLQPIQAAPARRPDALHGALSASGGGSKAADADQGVYFRPLVAAFHSLFMERCESIFERVESELVHAAYAHTGGNQVHTANLLGITRNMLRTQLRRHGLLEPGEAASGDSETELQSGVR